MDEIHIDMMGMVISTRNERQAIIWKNALSFVILADVIINLLILVRITTTDTRGDWNDNIVTGMYVPVISFFFLHLYQLCLYYRTKYSKDNFSKPIIPWLRVLTIVYLFYGIFVLAMVYPPVEKLLDDFLLISLILLISGLLFTAIKISGVTIQGNIGYELKERLSYYSIFTLPFFYFRNFTIFETAKSLARNSIRTPSGFIFVIVVLSVGGVLIFGANYLIFNISQRFVNMEEDKLTIMAEEGKWLEISDEKLYPQITNSEIKSETN